MGENMNLSVDLDWDTVDGIARASMHSVLENLQKDLVERKNGDGMAIFVTEQEFDVMLIEKHIEAFKLVLKYYGENTNA
jgi:tRNA(Ile2) C34 agmatinyltransferase TiaS